MKRLNPVFLLFLVACTRGDDSGETGDGSAECGDIDGPGGEVPNVLGNWTGDFGKNLFQEYCGLDGLNSGGQFPIDGAMEVGGRVPDTLYMTIDSLGEETRFWGVISSSGAISFSGEYTDNHGVWNIAFGGQARYDTFREKNVIEGFGWAGLEDGDGTIVCDVRGEWTATKSGN